jgi:hypothetical protein
VGQQELQIRWRRVYGGLHEQGIAVGIPAVQINAFFDGRPDF